MKSWLGIYIRLRPLHLKKYWSNKNIWPFHWVNNLHIQIMTEYTLSFIISALTSKAKDGRDM